MKNQNDYWKDWIGIGVCCFLILVGVGGCVALIQHDFTEKEPAIHKPK